MSVEEKRRPEGFPRRFRRWLRLPALSPLRNRAALKLALLAIVPFLVLALFASFIMYQNARSEVIRTIASELDRCTEKINIKLASLTERSNLVINTMAINGVVDPVFFMDIQRYQYDVFMIHLINQSLGTLETGIDKPTGDTSCIILYLDGYQGYKGRYLESTDDLEPTAFDRILRTQTAESAWLYTQRPEEKHLFVSLFRDATTLTGMKSVIEVRYPYSELAEALEAVVLPRGGVLYHEDGFGKVLSELPAAGSLLPSRTYGKHTLSNANPIIDGSTVTMVFPRQAVWTRVRYAIIVLGIGILLFMATNIFTISRTTARITDKMTAFLKGLRGDPALLREGERFLPVAAGPTEELDTLKNMFLKLLQEIKTAHADVLDVQAQKNMLEMELLQSRLNPHLLYNSLGVIRWSAMRASDERTVKIIEALTSYYRRVLTRGENFVAVRDELESLRQYVLIVNLTHEEEHRLEVDVDEKMLNMPILKQILQPLVENAVLHGLKNKDGGGLVSLKGTMENGDLHFQVIDNGYGIDPEVVERIMNMEYTSKYGGYGLRNSMKRIYSCYGDGYGIRLESEPGRGTTVHVRLRAEAEEGHAD